MNRRAPSGLAGGNCVFRRFVAVPILFALVAAVFPVGGVEAQPALTPVPVVSLGAPAQVPIGQAFTFTVTFDNQPSGSPPDVGYGPIIDLVFPVNGADGNAGTDTPDGIDFTGATYLGAPVTAVQLTFPNAGGGTGCVDHPYARDTSGAFIQVCGTAGDKLVVLQLPFGSFTPTQPAAVVSVGATLSNLADLSTPLTLRARSGFRFGADPLDNWCCDAVILNPPTNDGSGWPNAAVTPALLSIGKRYIGPEDETATGPNYPRQYEITVSVAPDQEVTELDVTDELPNNLAFLSVDAISAGGSVVQTPTVGAAANPPNNRLVVNFPSVTSVTGPATVTFSFFVPRLDANGSPVIPPLSGDDATSANRAGAVGDWTPFDARDAGGVNNAIAGGVCPACAILHTLGDRSIAVQKSVEIVTDTGPVGASPGDTLANTLQFQISDFFAFDGLVLTDTFSDGQLWDAGTEPTLSLTEHGALTSDAMLPANFTVVHDSPGTGTTTVTFRVSDELVSRSLDAAVLGGCVPPGGTSGPPPNCSSFNSGATTGTLVFRTVIQDQFTDTFPSGDPSVDQGDVLGDDVTIDGDVLDTSTLAPTGSSEADGSSDGVAIPRGEPDKSIYAVDGVICSPQPCTGVEIDPGDTLTFRIQYGLPTSDFEDLYLIDFLPLPVLDAAEVTAFDATVSDTAPPVGTAKFGPADSFYNSRPPASNIVPTITTDSVGNSVQFTYGSYDDPTVPPPSTAVDILFTVTVSNDPFTDRLLLTNQLRVHEGSTNSTDIDADGIVQFTLREPFLVVKKGVIATDQTAGVFTPTTTGPVSFSAPGTPGTRFTPPIDSNGLTAEPVDSDLSGVDADDLVSFTITIENQGSSPDGAFDIVITDTLQPGFVIPAGGLNLTVTRGDGSAVSYLGADTDLFGSGIELVDPGLGPGVCEAHAPTGGRNIIVITYDLEIDPSAEPGQVILNTAEVTNYAGEEGGEDHTGTGSNPAFQDQASTTIATVGLAKDVTDTNQGFTSGLQVAIGESVEYTLTVTVPEGTSSGVTLTDTLDQGLAFVSLDSVTPSSADLTWSGAASAVFSAVSPAPVDAGRRMVVDFGDVTNVNTDDGVAETITLVYRVVVVDSAGNNASPVTLLNNTAVWAWSAGSVNASAPAATVVEPRLQVTKAAVPNTGDAGDTISFTLTISHAASSNAGAFDLTLSDVLPAGMTYTGGTLNCAGGSLTPDSCTLIGNTLTAAWTQPTGFPLGSTSQFTFNVTLDSSVAPGQIILNTADLTWTSLPGDVTAPQTPNNGLSVERTGDAGGPGGAVNDYRAAGTAQVTVFSQPTKSIVATSESHTGFVGGYERLTIGEIVRYRLVFQLAEGSATDFQLRDLLPPGLRFRDDNTAMVALVSNDPVGGITSSTLSGPGLAVSGNETTVAFITPTFVLPDNAVSTSPTAEDDTYVSGTDPYFKLGNLINADRDVDQEFVVLEFNAVAENIAGNQGYDNTVTPPTAVTTTRNNGFEARVSGAVVGTSATVGLRISEPALTLTKTITTTPADAGDLVVYRYTVANVSGATASAAFDLEFSDTLDPNLAFQSISLFSVSGGNCGAVVPAFSGSAAGQVVSASLTCLNTGGTALIDLTARAIDGAPMGTTIPNGVTVRYTSLPGDNGTSPNPTGSSAPGAPGTDTGERTGSGGTNDYSRSANVTLSLRDPALSKTISATSVASTASGEFDISIVDLVIGEDVTFEITATLPEGTAVPLRLTDNLPTVPGGVLSVVNASIVSIGSQISTSIVPTITLSDGPDPDSLDDQVVFGFGNATNTPDGVENDADRIVVRVIARVENVAENQNADRLTNSATLTYNAETVTTSADVEIVEPELAITKLAGDDTPALGQVVTYTLTVSHLPASTADAQDVVVRDTIPAGLTYVPGSASAPAGWTADASGAPTLVFSGSLTRAAASVAFTYQATLGVPPAVVVGDALTNTGVVAWTAIPGADANERTGTGVGPNDYASSTTETVTASEIDLTLTKTDGGISATPGQTYAYTLTIRNIGNVSATAVTVTDTVPLYTTFNPAGSSLGWTCLPDNSAGSVCTNDVGTLAAGGSLALTFSVTVDGALPVLVTQTSNAARVDDINEPVILQGNNSDTETTPLGAAPDLVITKDDSLSIISPNQVLTYVLTYTNAGDQDASGVAIAETVPAGTTFSGPSGAGAWSCAPGAPAGSSCTFDVGGLAVGAGGSVSFVVIVNDPAGVGSVINTATIGDDGTNGPDQNPADNTATDADNLVTLPDADLTKTLDSTSQAHTSGLQAGIGEILTYQVVMTIPQGTMPSAVLTDVLDRGLAFVDCLSLTPSGGLATSWPGGFAAACAGPTVAEEPAGSSAAEDQGRRVTFSLGTLTSPGPADASLTLRYRAVVLDNTPNSRGDPLTNSAHWTWTGGDLRASAMSVTLVEPTLTLSKTAAPTVAPPGAPITITLTVAQDSISDSDAFDLVLRDVLPVGLTYVGGLTHVAGLAPDPGGLTESGGTITAAWASFPLGSSSTIEFQVALDPLPAGTRVRNQAALEWTSLPDDNVSAPYSLSPHNALSTERRYDPTTGADFYQVVASATVSTPALPATGFAPGRTTDLPPTPETLPYRDLGALWLDIPSLGLRIPVVGVPVAEGGWDLTWLWGQAGYLAGTAFPTLPGNSALTAHVYLPDGRPGPFVHLGDLQWGDEIILHSGPLDYIYQVRQVVRVRPDDLSVLRHEEYSWLTLITCQGYDETRDSYRWRLAVRAVLVEATRH